MFKIVIDLDGVLRDLCLYLSDRFNVPYPDKWFWTYKDKDIFQWIKEDNYYALIYAPITKYFYHIMELVDEIEIWTCQPDEWKPFTKLWLENNIIKDYKIIYLNTEQKRQKLDQNKNLVLIEDSPNFSDYERIILIDTPYNQEVEALRIHNPEELRELLNELQSEKKEVLI